MRTRELAQGLAAGGGRRHAGLDRQSGAAGVERLVGVGGGGAPEGHDRVADELVDRAALGLDRLAGELEELADDRHHAVAQALAQAGEAGEVGEQDGELPALAAGLGAHAAGERAGGPARSG